MLATVSDKKLQHTLDNVTVDYFTADVVSANDYYPFGMMMPGRKYSVANTNYRYGFNGKENDNEVKGEGIQQDYGLRIYDPRLGRFLSVDPLTKKFPMLTPYQFASNTPIQAIDLDGAEAFFVHGTEATNKRWSHPFDDSNPEDKTLEDNLFKLTNNTIKDDNFLWTREVPNRYSNNDNIFSKGTHPLDRLQNDKTDRKIAAEDLVKYVMDFRKANGIDTYDDKGNLTSMGKEPVTFIAHSHGGNVAIQAAKMLYEAHGIQSDIIGIATPAYTRKGHIENPAENPGVRKFLNIWNKIDGVSGGLAGKDYYPIGPNSKVQRIEVNASKHYSSWEWLDAHSFDNNYMKDFTDQVNQSTNSQWLKK